MGLFPTYAAGVVPPLQDMMEKFGRYGRVRECRIVRNPHNNMESKGALCLVD